MLFKTSFAMLLVPSFISEFNTFRHVFILFLYDYVFNF